MSTTEYACAIEAHYIQNWSAPLEKARWSKGPIDELPSDFHVLVFRRTPETVVYATRCMSQPEDVERIEIHLLTRSTAAVDSSIVEMLTAVAHYHRTGRPLNVGHSVNFGRPWVAGSSCSYGLLSLPYLDGPDLEWLSKPEVRFLWLIPITGAEVQFKKDYGLEALEHKFEEEQFDYLDPLRSSVV